MTQIQVVRFSQGGVTLYSGMMTVGQLLNHAVTTEWDPDLGWTLEGQGYQRAPEEGHWRRIGTFLEREGNPLLPTNALLATRNHEYGELQYTPVAGDLGYLEVPEGRQLFVVDYQHRLHGFRHAINELGATTLRDTMIPVTILSDATVVEETKQFYLINNKQKRVDTDLALTLINALSSESDEEDLANLVGPGNRFRIRGTRLVVRLAQMKSGPWVDKIEEPNAKGRSNQIASIKSFVDSLRPIVSIRSPVNGFSDDALIEVIQSVWTGILGLWPEWNHDFSRYTVQRTIGLFVFHRIARQILIPKMLRENDRSPQLVTSALSNGAPSLDRDFWRTGGRAGGYSSGSGHRELAEQIISELQ